VLRQQVRQRQRQRRLAAAAALGYHDDGARAVERCAAPPHTTSVISSSGAWQDSLSMQCAQTLGSSSEGWQGVALVQHWHTPAWQQRGHRQAAQLAEGGDGPLLWSCFRGGRTVGTEILVPSCNILGRHAAQGRLVT
jgi:hypothetical protein